MTMNMFVCRNLIPVLSALIAYHHVGYKSNSTVVTCGAGTANPSGAPVFTSVFSGVRVARSFVLCVIFCRLLFFLLAIAFSVLLTFLISFHWGLCYYVQLQVSNQSDTYATKTNVTYMFMNLTFQISIQNKPSLSTLS